MIVVLGAGGTGRSIMAAIPSHVDAVFLDDRVPEGVINGRKNLGALDRIHTLGEIEPIVGFGCLFLARRKELFLELTEKYPMAHVIHHAAVVEGSAAVGAGTYLAPFVVVMPNAVVGRNVVVCTHASIDHDCVVGDHAYISPGVNLAGGVRVGESVFLGTNATVLPQLEIGAHATIGAGAVVTRNVAPGATVAGVPARGMKA